MEEGASNTKSELAPPTLIDTTMSPTIGKLADALSKAQGLMTGALKGSESQMGGKTTVARKYKYATLADVWESIREPLSKNGLSVIQTTSPNAFDQVSVITMLAHSSGEWIRGELVLKNVASDPKGYGSALTYARRYGVSSITGAIALDDDAEHAAGPKKSTTSGAPPSKSGGKKAEPEGDKPANKAQIAALKKAMKDAQEWENFIADGFPNHDAFKAKLIELSGGQKAEPPAKDGAKQEAPKDPPKADAPKDEPVGKGHRAKAKELF